MKTSKNILTFDVITLMPEMFLSISDFGITGRAFRDKRVNLNLWNPREFAKDIHKSVDDRPYGGGPGMLMMLEPLLESVNAAKKRQKEIGINKSKVIHMTPKGKIFNNKMAESMVKEDGLILIASRYEGVDERINNWVDDEVSIGDFVISGGELASMVVMDSLIRKIPGALNDIESVNQDSFVNGLLEYPHFTRPEVFDELKVPEVLLSGDHEKIRVWRLKESLRLTRMKRPDLLAERLLTKEESRLLGEIQNEQEQDSYK